MGATPWGAAIGAAAEVAKAPPAGPSEAKSSGSVGGAKLDNSGWNVTFGSNSGISTNRDETATPAGPLSGVAAYAPYIALAVGAVVLLKIMKKRAP